MTKEEMIEQLKHDRDLCNFDPFTGESEPISEDCRKSAEALDYAIKALEQQPCEDCVSRQAVEKITWEDPSYSDALNVLTEVRDKVKALPPVTPTFPKGATNGDVIKAMFPNCEYQRFNIANTVEMYITNKSGEKWLTVFDSIWWDEPYKGGRT